MAKSVQPFTWQNGFREPGQGTPWVHEPKLDDEGEEPHYIIPPSSEILSSSVHNSVGLNVVRTWPTIYDGTSNPHGVPSWWKPPREVDVLICGAGPSGLQVALSLVRQGVSFRIVGKQVFTLPQSRRVRIDSNKDRAPTPLTAGRADGVQPRFLETLHSWGLATEVHEEGPLIERTAIYRDGIKLLFHRSHQSDSRYRGLHIITQGQLERIYIRDLLRHQKLVERQTVVTDYAVDDQESTDYPVQALLKNDRTGAEERVRAKFLVGSDGAASMVRKRLNIPFDGVSTDIYWGIMDCIFETDYPHAWVFGSIVSSKHGGCVIIPREDGYIRLYTQLDVSSTSEIAKSRQFNARDLAESGGRVDTSTITAEEVLEQANRIFSPYKLKFGAPLSWFAVWKISERVARTFSSEDNRVHLVGDAAHVHSVMGAFGLNASIMDSANLAWKIGLCAKNLGRLSALGPTYDAERRLHANRIIQVSGSYLRFICNSDLPLAEFEKEADTSTLSLPDVVQYNPGNDLPFLRDFFSTNGPFLLGVDAPYPPSMLNPGQKGGKPTAIVPHNGVRAPNPRLCFSRTSTGYLYDALSGAAIIHIVLFASDLQGPIRTSLILISAALASPNSFYALYGGAARFNIVLVTKCLPHEAGPLLESEELRDVREKATVLYDDRAPDEDAHMVYGVKHEKGAVVVVRPDLWVGMSCALGEWARLEGYFEGWLVPVAKKGKEKSLVNGVK